MAAIPSGHVALPRISDFAALPFVKRPPNFSPRPFMLLRYWTISNFFASIANFCLHLYYHISRAILNLTNNSGWQSHGGTWRLWAVCVVSPKASSQKCSVDPETNTVRFVLAPPSTATLRNACMYTWNPEQHRFTVVYLGI